MLTFGAGGGGVGVGVCGSCGACDMHLMEKVVGFLGVVVMRRERGVVAMKTDEVAMKTDEVEKSEGNCEMLLLLLMIVVVGGFYRGKVRTKSGDLEGHDSEFLEGSRGFEISR